MFDIYRSLESPKVQKIYYFTAYDLDTTFNYRNQKFITNIDMLYWTDGGFGP